MDSKTLNKIEDELLATIAAGEAEEAKARYNAEYLPLRQKQEAIIARHREGDDPPQAVGPAVGGELLRGGAGDDVGAGGRRHLPRPRLCPSSSRAPWPARSCAWPRPWRAPRKGDLSDVLEFDARTDELGELSRSINGTYLYLQEMSSVATSLAARRPAGRA